MSALHKFVAAHPLANKTPYNAIKFSRVDGCGTPLYTVGRASKEMGAAAALQTAAEQFGGHCFFCDEFMPKERVAELCTKDHVQPKSGGGHNYLHNLVFACRPCNQKKGATDLVSFDPEDARKYLLALDAHLVRCLQRLNDK